MEDLMLSESEYRLMDVIWEHAPIESGKLVKVCETELNWKKSTTYTMLHKLIVKQMVANTDSLVTVLIPRVSEYVSVRDAEDNCILSLKAPVA